MSQNMHGDFAHYVDADDGGLIVLCDNNNGPKIKVYYDRTDDFIAALKAIIKEYEAAKKK